MTRIAQMAGSFLAVVFSGCSQGQTPASESPIAVEGIYSAEARKPLDGGKIDEIKADRLKYVTLRLLSQGRWVIELGKAQWTGSWSLAGDRITFTSNDKNAPPPPLTIQADGTLLSNEETANRTRVAYRRVSGGRK